MEFWSELITKKSWELLIKLRKMPIDFILIGGWAAYLWSKLHKSKDIDIVIENYKDLDYLKQNFELRKNNRLKKYEIKIDEIDIDIYVPYFSKLSIPVEDIVKHTTKIENIKTVIPEILLILKQGAELDRAYSVKGKKDQIDILTLITHADIDWKKYYALLRQYKKEHFLKRLKTILNEFKDLKYIELNPREYKLTKKEILDKLKKV